MKRLALVAVALTLVLIAGVRAQDCTGQSCIYLPGVQVGPSPLPADQAATTDADGTATSVALTATSTPHPIVGTVPVGSGGCELNAPAPVEGAQAWVNTRTVNGFFLQTLCVRLVVQGRFYYNFTAHTVIYGRTQDWAFDTTNNADGVERLDIGAPDTVPGSTVRIDVAVPYLDRVYLAHTSFVVPTQPTLTPTITLTPTP